MAVALDSATTRYSNLCRLCATKTGIIQGINVFANEANYRQIFKKIEACLPIQISETDALPKIVCENCLYKVELLFDFRERALRTETVLVELFKQLHSHPLQLHNGNHHVHHLKMDVALEHVISQQSSLLNDGLSHVSDIDLPQLSHRDSMIILSEHNVPLDQLSQHDINQELSNHSIDASENILGGANGYNSMEYQHHTMLNEDINLSHTNMHHQMKNIIDHQDSYASLSDLGHVKNIGCNGVQRLMMNEAHFMHNSLNDEENLDSFISSMFCTTCGKSFDDKILLQAHYQEHYSKPCNAYPHEKEMDNVHRKELHGSSSTSIELNTHNLEGEPETQNNHQLDETSLNKQSPEIEERLPLQLEIPLEEPVKPQQVITNDCLKTDQFFEDDNDYANDCDSDTLDDNLEVKPEIQPEKATESEKNSNSIDTTSNKKKKIVQPKLCTICDKQFTRSSALRQHMRKHSGEQPYKCKTCDKSFRSKIGLDQHEANHTGKFDYLCNICGKGFQSKSYLMVHQRVHSDAKPYSCTTCKQGFKSKQALLDHTNRHLGLKPYKCPICRNGYITNSLLKAHQKRVHSGVDNRKHPCSICDKIYVSKSYLTTHMRIHRGEKPEKCEVCGKGFQTKVDLKVHLTMHTGEKSYVCEICGKAFARRDALRCHRRSHTGERPYKCDICGQTFTQYSPMLIHRRYHTGERPYECEDCGDKFVSRATMLVHRKKHIKNEIKSEIFIENQGVI